jgi:hypothetical protein
MTSSTPATISALRNSTLETTTSAVGFSRNAPISASARAGTVASSMRPLSR